MRNHELEALICLSWCPKARVLTGGPLPGSIAGREVVAREGEFPGLPHILLVVEADLFQILGTVLLFHVYAGRKDHVLDGVGGVLYVASYIHDQLLPTFSRINVTASSRSVPPGKTPRTPSSFKAGKSLRGITPPTVTMMSSASSAFRRSITSLAMDRWPPVRMDNPPRPHLPGWPPEQCLPRSDEAPYRSLPYRLP